MGFTPECSGNGSTLPMPMAGGAQGKSSTEGGQPAGCQSGMGLCLQLLMRKGSRLCSQHPLPKENTAAANLPATLHENKTINKL